MSLPAFDTFYGNFFSQFASGAVHWPGASAGGEPVAPLYDLVHAAYNGRGKFYTATSEDALTQAFNDILTLALTQSATSGISSAGASGSRLTSGTVAYVTSYAFDPSKTSYDATNNQWGVTQGNLITGTIGGWSGAVSANAGNNLYAGPLWPNGATIPVPASRNILTAGANGKGISFDWSTLNAGADPLVTASGLTQTDASAVRNNPLGDIVDSQLTFVSPPSRLSLDPNYLTFINTVNNFNGSKSYRNGVVYVGANDGMLHGFDVGQGVPGTQAQQGSGSEVMAYVPRGLLPNLHTHTFANADYVHRYWVNGSPFSSDVQLDAKSYGAGTNANTNPGNWATVLAGTLGAGGPGYFVLDVTNPAGFKVANAASVVLIDATDTSSTSPLAAQQITNGPPGTTGQRVLNYIGYQFNQPVMDMYTTNQPAQITQINTQDTKGEWAVIMGNGYNSASGVPVLLIQSLSHPGRPLYTVAASCAASNQCVATGNGLGAPRPIDVDGNGTADIVYAGDLLGNLWKFDISNPDHAQWNVAYGGKPMFTAVGLSGAVQPITSAPVAVPNPNGGGFMVVFGTGKNLTVADTTDTNLNSVYALYDNQPMSVHWPDANTPASYLILATRPAAPATPSTPATPALPQTFCAASGTGETRYSACLYQQGYGSNATSNGGTLGAPTNGVQVGATGTLANEQIGDGTGGTLRGWYYDIPDIVNGNAGKVLANPMVSSNNLLMFYSQNVASSAGLANTPTLESCSPTVVNSAVTTVNFMNVFKGNAPNNSIVVNGVEYSTGQGNRFQINGVTTFIHDGTDSLTSVGGKGGGNGNCPNGICPVINYPPGGHAGWRIAK